jgi:hypothetical protein
MFHFSLQLLFKIFFTAINIFQAKVKMHTEKHIDLQAVSVILIFKKTFAHADAIF